MKTLMSLSTATLLVAGSAAFAGGMGEPVMAPAPVAVAPMVVAPMSADWSGFYVGGQYGLGTVDTAGTSTDLNAYGVHAGYLYDLGSVVLGGEASYAMLDLDGVNSDGTYVARAGAIAGYDAGRLMPYLTAGYAYLNNDNGTTSASDNGYYYGVGATYAVSNSLQVGIEYLDHRFDDFNSTGSDIEAKTTSLKVSYKF